MATRQSARIRRLAAGGSVGAAIGLIAALVAFGRPLVVERGEYWTYDLRARSGADPAAASPAIVIIDIAEQDIYDAENNFGVTWPWPRAMYGYITQLAHRAGARAVVFDWLFQDRGQYSVADAEEFAESMREAGNAVIGLALSRHEIVARGADGPWAARLGEYETRAEAEQVALQLMAWNTTSYLVGDGPTTLYYGGKTSPDGVLAAWERMAGAEELAHLFAGEGEDAWPEPPEPVELNDAQLAAAFTVESLIAARDGLELGDSGAVKLPERGGMDPPLAVIAAGPARAGNVYQDFEADGIMRRHTPLVRYGGRAYPSLALAAFLVAHPEVTPRLEGRDLVLGERRIPLDEEGKIPIRFHGQGIYQRVPAYEVLRSLSLLEEGEEPSVPLETLRDKYVIVSATGQALRDIRVTPVSKVQQGAEIQATALDNLEQGDLVRRLSPGADAALALLLCIAVAGVVVAVWTSIRSAVAALAGITVATVALIGGYWLLAMWLYEARGVWMGVAAAGGGAAASAFGALLATTAQERRGRRFVQEALGRYTSPALVRQLTEHPEYLSLEWGETRDMTVFFSDVADFTSISEGLEPEKLVALLNDYLTNMTDLVLAHGGVVDKYIGDAVMAFWGAPLADRDHARHAVLCAVAMRERCAELRPAWQEKYGKTVVARAGINSGPAVVGNMGSRHKYNYTVMGDMVNLASRLEGANKAYGTELMISESTLAAVGDVVDVRELDWLVVKGKEQPVRVYEVLGERGKTEPMVLRAAEAFGEGLALYRERRFAPATEAFERALALRPQDGPSATYIERCRHFQAQPPEPGWSGIWHMKEK